MKISLVIPVKDESSSVGRLLESIFSQVRLPDEVVFVDAGSTDATKDIITAYNNGRLNMRTLSIGPAYPGTARNAGAEASSCDYIAFTDGGIELDRDWLDELCKAMAEGDAAADVVYGSYRPRTDTFFKQCLALAVVPPFKRRSSFIASSLMKKSVWETAGGFPNFRAAEDRIFMENIAKKAYRIRYCPTATAVWDIPHNVKGVFGRFYNYSYHDLRAGRTRDWHVPVLKMYLFALVGILLGFTVSPLFFPLPLFGFLLRVTRKIIINEEEPYFPHRFLPLYVMISAVLLFMVDMAMFSGWARYIVRKQGME